MSLFFYFNTKNFANVESVKPSPMTKKHLSKQVFPLPGKTDYQGRLRCYQIEGNLYHGKRYQRIEYDYLNSRQNFLYYRALFGLSVYTQSEIKNMRKDQRARIKKVHKRTRIVLNVWKQQLINQFTNNFFIDYFPKSPLTKSLVENTIIDPEFKCSISLETLKINKRQVVDKLINEGILPHNFYKLKPNLVCN